MTAETLLPCREAFERWAAPKNWSLEIVHGRMPTIAGGGTFSYYKDTITSAGYFAWQAAWEWQASTPAPSASEDLVDTMTHANLEELATEIRKAAYPSRTFSHYESFNCARAAFSYFCKLFGIEPGVPPRTLSSDTPKRLWLWKNFVDGIPEYWAFDNRYPRRESGDPLVIGEPCGYALFKPSVNGEADHPEATDDTQIALIMRISKDALTTAQAEIETLRERVRLCEDDLQNRDSIIETLEDANRKNIRVIDNPMFDEIANVIADIPIDLDQQAQITTLSQQVERMREALKPFARFANSSEALQEMDGEKPLTATACVISVSGNGYSDYLWWEYFVTARQALTDAATTLGGGEG